MVALFVLSSSACALDRAGLGAARDGGEPMVDAALPLVDGALEPRDGSSPDAAVLLDAGPADDAAAEDAAAEDAALPLDAGDPCSVGSDADGDGVSDACDDWPCGARPSVPGTVSAEHIEVSSVRLGDASDAVSTAVAARGSMLRVRFEYAIDDTGCGGCIDQIEIGLVPGDRAFCAYDANPPGSGARGSVDRMVRMPSSPGPVALRFNLGQNYGCEHMGASTWWDAAPGESQTFAVICIE